MSEFLSKNGGLIAVVVMVAMSLNFVLSGISQALAMIKDKTESKVDDKAFDFISKVLTVLQKIVDWGSGNTKH